MVDCSLFTPRYLKCCLIYLGMCCSASLVFAEELSFEEWESSIESNVGEKRSNINDFQLTPITGEELSNTAIRDALPTRSASDGAPAFKVMNDKENRSQESRSQDALLEQDADASVTETVQVPQEVDFQQEVFAAPDGRDLHHNNKAFERP